MRTAALAIATLLTVPLAHAQRLVSPWDAQKITPTAAPYTCPAAPAYATTLTIAPYYIDKPGSVADPAKLAAFQAGSAGPTHVGQFTTQAADAYLHTGSTAAAHCVFSLLATAAQAAAWTDRMPDFSGVYLQSWLLSGAAMAYLKVRTSGLASSSEDAEIRRWFLLLSTRVRDYYDEEMPLLGPGKENNHLYWASLAITAEAIIDDNHQALEWGLYTAKLGIDAIQPDGSLQTELARAGMALHYHLYAVGPLVLTAELAETNDIALYAVDDNALARLVDYCTAALEDPKLLEKATGVPQIVPSPLAGLDIGWAVPWVRRFPNPRLSALLARAQWTHFWQWGGDPPL